jgi:hypothetical protein
MEQQMTIHIKLAKIQQKLKAPKGQRNDFGKYNYRSAEDILESVKPLLGDLALTINDELIFSGMLEDEIVGAGSNAMKVQTQRVYIKSTVTLSDGKESISTSAVAREASIKKGQDSSQTSGATGSYSRKYALNGLFSIDDAKDSDSTNKHDEDKVADLDMSLEGMSEPVPVAPAKRVSKKLMQDLMALVIESEATGEHTMMNEALAELDENEKQKLWSQCTGKQQDFIRSKKGM